MAMPLLHCPAMKLFPAAWRLAALAALLIPATPVLAQQHDPKIDHALQAVHGGSRQRVIVRFRPGTGASVEQTASLKGNKIRSRHASIGAFSMEVDAEALAALARNPNVESVGIDAEVSSEAYEQMTSIPSNVLRSTLGESEYSKGAGIGVAVIDSGIAPLPAFAGRITAFYDFTSGVPIATTPNDEYGHGTHVAGLIGANDADYMGVAPSVNFIGLKVLNKLGKGRTSDVITALEFAVSNRVRLNIQVVNLSLGHPIFARAADDALVQAVETAVRAGLIVVVSAGNIGISPATGRVGYAGITSPGNAPSAITVGAVNTQGTITHSDDDVSPYSSRGPTWYDGFAKPDVVAPGHNMISVMDVNSYLFKQYPSLDVKVNRKWYVRLSGTSMATAVATGVVATVLEAHKTASSYFALTPQPVTANAMKAMLQYTALPIRRSDGSTPDGLTEGTGEINAEGSIRFAWLRVAVWANPNIATQYAQYFASKTTIAGSTLKWAARLIWGQQILTGAGVDINYATWAANVIWGDNII